MADLFTVVALAFMFKDAAADADCLWPWLEPQLPRILGAVGLRPRTRVRRAVQLAAADRREIRAALVFYASRVLRPRCATLSNMGAALQPSAVRSLQRIP